MNSKYYKYIVLAFVLVGVFFVVQYNEQITVGMKSWVKKKYDTTLICEVRRLQLSKRIVLTPDNLP